MLLRNNLLKIIFGVGLLGLSFGVEAANLMACDYGVDLLKQREGGSSIESRVLGREIVSLNSVKETTHTDRYGNNGNLQIAMDVREGGFIGLELKVLKTNARAEVEFTVNQLRSDRILLSVHSFAPVGSDELITSEVGTRFWVECTQA